MLATGIKQGERLFLGGAALVSCGNSLQGGPRALRNRSRRMATDLRTTDLTKTQIDRLGDRLRRGDATEDDLRSLDQFRRSFVSAYEGVVRGIRDELGLKPTGRPAKSTTSIIEKLRRETIRLTQIQDIAGCRVVIADVATQERVVQQLMQRFPLHALIDRRERPSHGYRAVHVVVTEEGKPIEIQVRTELQHRWAEVSEKLSDVVDPSIKYGGGEGRIPSLLSEISELIAAAEQKERDWDLRSPLLDALALGGFGGPGFATARVGAQYALGLLEEWATTLMKKRG